MKYSDINYYKREKNKEINQRLNAQDHAVLKEVCNMLSSISRRCGLKFTLDCFIDDSLEA